MHGVVTLGAGIAGLSFSYHYQHLTDVYEKASKWGGRCRSHFTEGFTFDEGIHVSFTGEHYVRKVFASSVGSQYCESTPAILNRFADKWVRHPIETNLKGLPTEIIIRCLVDFIRAEQDRNKRNNKLPKDYNEWLIAQFGRTITECFHGAYTRKYWTVAPEYLTTEWIGQRIHRPTLEEVLRGAISDNFHNFYYINSFRYPEKGGYQSFLHGIAADAAINYDFDLVELDHRNRKLIFKNGFQRHYDTLVSSLPLPELVRCIRDCPKEIKEAASNLVHTSVLLINLGIKRADVAKCHWFYLYDENFLPARVHFTNTLSVSNAPPGCTGIQAEVYYSSYKPLKLSTSNIIDKTIENLMNIAILDKDDNIILTEHQDIKYANVMFNRDYGKNRDVILDFLQKNNIYSIGRYGNWAYLWSDQSFLSGMQTAETVRRFYGMEDT